MKYSVIIPAYNIEKHCYIILDFIETTKKTRNDIEYIIINDGSTDNTDEILSSYNSFTYINNLNHGVSFSRNIGIQKAKGEYILFLDADDNFSYNIFDTLDMEIKKNHSGDVYLFNYNVNNNVMNSFPPHIREYDQNKILTLFLRHKLNICICSICFRASFINKENIRFPENYNFGEDVYFLITSLLKTNEKISYTNEILFNYNLNTNGTVQSPLTKNKINVISLFDKIELHQSKKTSMLESNLIYFKQRTFFYLIKLAYTFNVDNENTLHYLFLQKKVLDSQYKNSLLPIIVIFKALNKIILLILIHRFKKNKK